MKSFDFIRFLLCSSRDDVERFLNEDEKHEVSKKEYIT